MECFLNGGERSAARTAPPHPLCYRPSAARVRRGRRPQSWAPGPVSLLSGSTHVRMRLGNTWEDSISKKQINTGQKDNTYQQASQFPAREKRETRKGEAKPGPMVPPRGPQEAQIRGRAAAHCCQDFSGRMESVS